MRIIELFIALGLLYFVNYAHYDESRQAFENLVQACSLANIKFPRIAAAQILLETGYLSSKIYKINNNLFGMKTSSRHNIEANGHAAYNSVAESILDYAAFQSQILKNKSIKNEEEYLRLLDNLPFCKGCRYAEDPSYTKKLKKILQKFHGVHSFNYHHRYRRRDSLLGQYGHKRTVFFRHERV
jgi:hypothetical protein